MNLDLIKQRGKAIIAATRSDCRLMDGTRETKEAYLRQLIEAERNGLSKLEKDILLQYVRDGVLTDRDPDSRLDEAVDYLNAAPVDSSNRSALHSPEPVRTGSTAGLMFARFLAVCVILVCMGILAYLVIGWATALAQAPQILGKALAHSTTPGWAILFALLLGASVAIPTYALVISIVFALIVGALHLLTCPENFHLAKRERHECMPADGLDCKARHSVKERLVVGLACPDANQVQSEANQVQKAAPQDGKPVCRKRLVTALKSAAVWIVFLCLASFLIWEFALMCWSIWCQARGIPNKYAESGLIGFLVLIGSYAVVYGWACLRPKTRR